MVLSHAPTQDRLPPMPDRSDDGIFVYESSLVPDDTDTDIVIGD